MPFASAPSPCSAPPAPGNQPGSGESRYKIDSTPLRVRRAAGSWSVTPTRKIAGEGTDWRFRRSANCPGLHPGALLPWPRPPCPSAGPSAPFSPAPKSRAWLGPGSDPLDRAPRLPHPVDGRHGACREPLQPPDLDPYGEARRRACGVAAGPGCGPSVYACYRFTTKMLESQTALDACTTAGSTGCGTRCRILAPRSPSTGQTFRMPTGSGSSARVARSGSGTATPTPPGDTAQRSPPRAHGGYYGYRSTPPSTPPPGCPWRGRSRLLGTARVP